MYVTAVVLAAGKGLRLKTKISKPLIEINSHPLIFYCLNTLSNHPFIKDIIVVANHENLKCIRKTLRQYRIAKIKNIVLGGRLRQDSVMSGLEAMDKHTDLVLIQDGVRPFIDRGSVSSVIKAAKRYGAAIVGVPVKATIKKIKNQKAKAKSKFIIERTLNRNHLWEVQTPQVFKKDLILKAYKKFVNAHVTDDASLVEKLGRRVKVVMGSYFNIKITTPEDLIIARAIAKNLRH